MPKHVKGKKRPTPKQQKLISILLENLGTAGSTKTQGEMLKEAGYAPGMVKNPQQVMESETIQEGVKDVVAEMERIRLAALGHITDFKLAISSAKDNATIAATMTKDVQLLTGKETERVGFSLVSLFNKAKQKNE